MRSASYAALVALAAVPAAMAQCQNVAMYMPLSNFQGPQACQPPGYNAAYDCGTAGCGGPTTPDSLRAYCESSCTARGASCAAFVAIYNQGDANIYSGQCFYYSTVPSGPQYCADGKNGIFAESQGGILNCFQQSTSLASSYCASRYPNTAISTSTVTSTVTPTTTFVNQQGRTTITSTSNPTVTATGTITVSSTITTTLQQPNSVVRITDSTTTTTTSTFTRTRTRNAKRGFETLAAIHKRVNDAGALTCISSARATDVSSACSCFTAGATAPTTTVTSTASVVTITTNAPRTITRTTTGTNTVTSTVSTATIVGNTVFTVTLPATTTRTRTVATSISTSVTVTTSVTRVPPT